MQQDSLTVEHNSIILKISDDVICSHPISYSNNFVDVRADEKNGRKDFVINPDNQLHLTIHKDVGSVSSGESRESTFNSVRVDPEGGDKTNIRSAIQQTVPDPSINSCT